MDPKIPEEVKKPEDDPGQAPKSPKPKPEKPAAKKPMKPLDPAVVEARAQDAQNKIVLDSAARVADKIQARLIFLIVDDPDDLKVPDKILKRKDLVLVVPEKTVDEDLKKQYKSILTLPSIKLSRLGKIKMTVMRSLAGHMLSHGDKIVCITGSTGLSALDSMLVLDIGKEYELLSSGEVNNISTQVRTEVFEELVTVATELANQGREGKPIGAIFVLGDTEKVMQISRQMIFNPFQGYPEEERNLLDPRLKETIKEFASLDGAFIIRDDGVVMAAGRHLNASLENQTLPQGLGARHAAAAGITSVTGATAIVISESTGTVRIFRNGSIFVEIEKAAPARK
jgi:diadenylate cyclase